LPQQRQQRLVLPGVTRFSHALLDISGGNGLRQRREPDMISQIGKHGLGAPIDRSFTA
jgi:hypothetical protein